MHKAIQIFLLSVCVCLFSFAQNEKDAMSWNHSKHLTWSDFKGKPNQNSGAAASTASGISFGFSVRRVGNRITQFTTNVECLFYPYESWVKQESANNHILGHEQLHFDITELHTRKFRKQISQMKPSSNIKSRLNTLYKSISKASHDMQKLYDKETNHSINKKMQAYWQTFINKELKKLETYKSK